MMQIVHVYVRVKPEHVDAFREATLANARASIEEPGIVRFDVIQQEDDPTRFVLVEIYRSPNAPSQHKATPHYATWRDTVAEMMAEPRSSTRYSAIFPAPEQWELVP
ncbi:MAG: antibiotic biosynthesis monooxygenase [Oscillochloris sp.]|nr:antibiotic biosynthesis monooxygenase [Oscillochloris sp.]